MHFESGIFVASREVGGKTVIADISGRDWRYFAAGDQGTEGITSPRALPLVTRAFVSRRSNGLAIVHRLHADPV